MKYSVQPYLKNLFDEEVNRKILSSSYCENDPKINWV